MTMPRKIPFYVQLALFLSVAGGTAYASGQSRMQENKVPGWVESPARRLANGSSDQP